MKRLIAVIRVLLLVRGAEGQVVWVSPRVYMDNSDHLGPIPKLTGLILDRWNLGSQDHIGVDCQASQDRCHYSKKEHGSRNKGG